MENKRKANKKEAHAKGEAVKQEAVKRCSTRTTPTAVPAMKNGQEEEALWLQGSKGELSLSLGNYSPVVRRFLTLSWWQFWTRRAEK